MHPILRFRKAWATLDTLDDRIYYTTLGVGITACLVSFVADIIQGLSPYSTYGTLALAVFFAVLQAVSLTHRHDHKLQKVCRVLLVVAVNFIFFPAIFFVSGGIRSGMILFYLLGLFLVAILLRGNLGGVLFLLSFLALELSITMADRFPSLVVEMTDVQHYQDVKVTLLLAGFSLYAMSVLIFMAYERERKHNEELMDQLRTLSVRDALSGLYNRRELFRRLDVMYQPEQPRRVEKLTREGHYIAMFDVDDFKHLNDTYGHSLGDTVLSQVARELGNTVDPDKGELAARYGGEEFVCILLCDSAEDAYRRVDGARKRVEALQWEDNPRLKVTVSGGLLSCESYTDVTQVMHDVDELLYEAKEAGKNRICVPHGEQS